jgi:LPXTG-motif cell wall-anchored protein
MEYKMKRIILSVLSAGFMLLGVSTGAVAQGACGDIVFTGDVATRFPNAKDYCLEVAERDGKQYAHFILDLQRVSGNKVYAKVKKPGGGFSETISFNAEADRRVTIRGREYRLRDLAPDQELDVWVPHDRWEFAVHETAADLHAQPTVTTYVVEEVSVEEERAPMLPKTASPMPFFGLLGSLFVMLGGGLAWLRRRAA